MLLARRAPNHVTGPNLPDRASPALHQAAAGRHDERLPQRVGMPCRAGAWLERDTDAKRACRLGRLEQGIDAYVPLKYSAGPLPEGCEPLRLSSMVAHFDLFGSPPTASDPEFKERDGRRLRARVRMDL
jgi:hypothetical protein